MRTLHDHEINDFNTDCVAVTTIDEPNHETGGGAHHMYGVSYGDPSGEKGDPGLAVLEFQNGPVSEAGVNGITNEALIAVVLDRLRSFQKSPYSCRENALMITKLEEALMWGHKRTLDRVRRGVEGKHEL